MLSPWIIRTFLTLPPLLASLIPHTFHRYHTPTIPTYYGISIAILRYIAMQLSTILFIMTHSIIVILFSMIM